MQNMFLSVSAQVFSQSYSAEYVPVSLSTSVQSELRCRICSCQSQHKCSDRLTVQNMFLSVSAQVFSQNYGAEYVPVSLSTSVQTDLRCRICSCQSQHKCSDRLTVQNMFLSVSAQVFSQNYGAEYVPVSLSTSVQSELQCIICSCQSQHKCSVRVTVHNMFLSVSAQVFSQSYSA